MRLLHRPLLLVGLIVACIAPAEVGRASPAPDTGGPAAVTSWARSQIAAVTARGLMDGSAAAFRPDAALTQRELSGLVARLTDRPPAATAAPKAPVSMAVLDARLVRALGLNAAADRFASAARMAGLAVPSRFGSEVVARLVGLRLNHPAAHDDLELLPASPATRAEAAYSAARFLQVTDAEIESVRAEAARFTLPALTPWQGLVLQTALGFVGYPYVWGGSSETDETPFGVHALGGFDCSGFVWRVYKLQRYTEARTLAQTLKGRTTYTMSAEGRTADRLPLARLQPADVLFFGPRGTSSKPGEIDHMAIYLGGGWVVHSSRYGVALAQLASGYGERFAWARRPLAEAGLA